MRKVNILADMTNPLKIEYPQADHHRTKVSDLPSGREQDIPNKAGVLAIEKFHNDEDADFKISSKREILSILQGLANQGTRIYMYYGSEPHCIMSTMLAANENGMWLNIVSSPFEKKQLLLSDKITFVSVHQHVKIQFEVRYIVSDLFEKNEALYMELPNYLLRIQRREFFRSAISPTDLVKCIIPIQSENPNDQVIMREAPLVDISGGGIRLLCEGHEAVLLPNKTFPDCQIILPDAGPLTVTIEVRNSLNFIAPNNVVHKRIGCRFINLNNQINIPLQRHIIRLQSESKARASRSFS